MMLGGWLLKFLLFVIVVTTLVRAVWRLLSGIVDGATDGQPRQKARSKPREVESVPLVRDPVCGTYVAKDKAVTLKRGDTTAYFCSKRCRDQHRQSS